MSGSGSKGKWEASSITEKDVKELQVAGYLSTDIAHRLPAKGQVIPTPEPGKRVVLIPHFLRGLGFPLHPFVRGLMFYHGLDFHDLAPNSFLHISVFIVVCEALIRIPPHFGLWLKIFNVKPKVVDRKQVDCSGDMISKLPNTTWPKGDFIETVKVWQQEWFYIAEPRRANWVAIPDF